MAKYSKFLVALLGFVVPAALALAGTDNAVLNAVIALLVALGVYQVKNQ